MPLTLLQLRQMFDAPLVSLLVVLLVGVLVRRRPRAEIGHSVRRWTLAAGLFAVIVIVIERLSWVVPTPTASSTAQVLGFVAPLGAGLIAVLVLMLPTALRQGTGTADLSPRTLTSFAARGWLLTLSALTVLILTVTALAGRASIPDEQGHYRHYEIELATGVTAGTDIYGWYYSVPSIIVLALLLVATLVAVRAVARPPLTPDLAGDAPTRRWRTRNIVAISAGAMLIHLAAVLNHLAGTAALSAGFTTDQGWVSAQPPLIILQAPMRLGATGVELVGWFLWFAVVLAALQSTTRETTKAPWHSVSR
ncbi:hypothetical protein M3148_16600 [Georgenia satyanarayanai]|uniref:hypothetical protein n=1 Tax=Georgenia satyanarayanai TaxID=860221 RepID=UPI00204016AD|nr:hypothetical protein [Georgenia satyanarayanai]MCM3662595.1 hypothetical protein [Georgenia satyanarayanai]